MIQETGNPGQENNPGKKRMCANNTTPTLVIKLSPETRRLIDGVEQGRITDYTFSGWFKHYWLLEREQKQLLWIGLSRTIDHDVFRVFRHAVAGREQQAMRQMISKRQMRGGKK